MPILSAENSFKQGLEALVDQNYVGAATYFRRAMDIEHQRNVRQPDMRYLSYYGVCRAKAHCRIDEGLHACTRAARGRNQDPEMFLNLGRVLLMARRKSQAFQAFADGLRIDPMHPVLNDESVRLESRLPRKARMPQRPGIISRMRSAFSRPAAPLTR